MWKEISAPDAAAPVYRQIYARIRRSILTGLVETSNKLPSTRSLAAELGVARGTVDAAYALLANEGLIEGRGAKGTFVTAALAGAQEDAPAMPRERRAESLSEAGTTGIAFRLGLPALDAFPRKIWSRLIAREARKLPLASEALLDPAGLPRLRQAVSSYLAIARGVICSPESIFITAGFQGALGLTARALLRASDPVVMEEPGYFVTSAALKAAQMRVLPVPVDAEGLDIGKARGAARSARLAVVTPTHQSPLGVTMSLARRLALLDWARGSDALILEDDYDGEFRYASAPIPALKSLDREQRVLYAGTFSKVLSPELRLGYLAVPDRYRARLERVAAGLQPAPSPLIQSALSEFMLQGHFTRHIKKMRVLYGERRAALAEALGAAFGDALSIELAAGGMHLIARPKCRLADAELVRRARLVGLAPKELSAFYAKADAASGLLLSFTNIPAEQASREAARLREALALERS
jgi:GntR family transcriptional regulator/MocR family aminotransferase